MGASCSRPIPAANRGRVPVKEPRQGADPSRAVLPRHAHQIRLNDRFELKAFHTAVLAPGRVPLDILQQVGDRWIAGQAPA